MYKRLRQRSIASWNNQDIGVLIACVRKTNPEQEETKLFNIFDNKYKQIKNIIYVPDTSKINPILTGLMGAKGVTTPTLESDTTGTEATRDYSFASTKKSMLNKSATEALAISPARDIIELDASVIGNTAAVKGIANNENVLGESENTKKDVTINMDDFWNDFVSYFSVYEDALE
jgi:hypothetical protein